ncbi:unnamed protein product [Orchesella dallaii]|uniref:Uncharacterized protein n=1 Tax=Orchesella dallaii TaxID=48710 RepID=A0ABP1Q433_9HEXA
MLTRVLETSCLLKFNHHEKNQHEGYPSSHNEQHDLSRHIDDDKKEQDQPYHHQHEHNHDEHHDCFLDCLYTDHHFTNAILLLSCSRSGSEGNDDNRSNSGNTCTSLRRPRRHHQHHVLVDRHPSCRGGSSESSSSSSNIIISSSSRKCSSNESNERAHGGPHPINSNNSKSEKCSDTANSNRQIHLLNNTKQESITNYYSTTTRR